MSDAPLSVVPVPRSAALALRFVGLDLHALRPYARGVLVTLLLVAVLSVLPSRSPYAVIPPITLVAVILGPQYLFASDERSDLDTLYTVLGLPRRAVVAGRYLTVTVLGVGLVLLGLIATVILAAVLRVPLELPVTAGLAVLAVVALCVLFAFQLPVFFAIGYTAARPVAFLVPGAVIVLGIVGAQLVPDAEAVLLSALLRTGTPLAAVLAVAVAAALLVGSSAVSRRLYARRDL
ncbi:ABC-2 transporter permease [Raineyella sp. LH-20]|uniref:ABC-2 transporter permease n=1 Tax=Raineyella sp. LH-20 TaxID=3081204 RepID=UPI002953D878|nr:ABC-2 transporter permease [Raineyella sp. LH-20]WOP18246.1 ABC-2 transporter permease [Raineyella sp. LH-20]